MKRYFHFDEYHTNLKTELVAGMTTFLSAAYILAVIPNMLAQAGMDTNATFVTTAIITALASILMGWFANFPLVLGPGIGTAALFTFNVVPSVGSWQAGLAIIFMSGLIFMLISLTGLRKVIVNAIPEQLKFAITVGIGCFIVFIGLKNSGIIVGHSSNLVSFGHFNQPQVLLAIIGIFITLVLLARKTPLAIFWGMISTAILGLVMGFCGIKGMPHFPEQWKWSFQLQNVGSFLTGFQQLGHNVPNIILLVFSFLFIDFFDTAGTLTATVTRLKDCSDAKERSTDRALLVDSAATVAGSSMGMTSITTLVESASGIEVGGRTGITAITAGCLFLSSLFISPLIQALITPAVTTPALVAVGLLMCRDLEKIQWSELRCYVSAMMTILSIILSFSIGNGIAVGFLTYTLMSVATHRTKELHPIVWVLDVLFVAYFYFII